MYCRGLPAVALGVLGVGFLARLITDPPSLAPGGPGVGYAASVVLVVGGGGVLAVALGAHAFRTDRVRLPASVLAGYLAVLAMYGVVRRGLLLGLSPGGFMLATLAVVLVAVYGTYRVTAPAAA